MLTKEQEDLAREMSDNILDGLHDLVESCLKALREKDGLSVEMEKFMRVYLTQQARFNTVYK